MNLRHRHIINVERTQFPTRYRHVTQMHVELMPLTRQTLVKTTRTLSQRWDTPHESRTAWSHSRLGHLTGNKIMRLTIIIAPPAILTSSIILWIPLAGFNGRTASNSWTSTYRITLPGPTMDTWTRSTWYVILTQCHLSDDKPNYKFSLSKIFAKYWHRPRIICHYHVTWDSTVQSALQIFKFNSL